MPSLWTPESWPERLAELEARSGDAKQAPLRRDIRSLGSLLGQVLRLPLEWLAFSRGLLLLLHR